MELLEIQGRKIEMITKKCKGCERVFKVSKNSPNIYHSKACEILNVWKRAPWLDKMDQIEIDVL